MFKQSCDVVVVVVYVWLNGTEYAPQVQGDSTRLNEKDQRLTTGPFFYHLRKRLLVNPQKRLFHFPLKNLHSITEDS
jgi:hypothetical protein